MLSGLLTNAGFWTAVGSLGTALAVFVAAWQVRRNTRQAVTDFEDDLSREYRQLARSIPVDIQLAREVPDEVWESAMNILLSYIDLCNEQVFLRQQGRISKTTWLNWVDGIRANLRREGIRQAWELTKQCRPNEFMELRRLEAETFAIDPRRWIPRRTRIRHFLLP